MKRIPPYLIFNKQVELPCSPFVEQAAKVFQHQYGGRWEDHTIRGNTRGRSFTSIPSPLNNTGSSLASCYLFAHCFAVICPLVYCLSS